MNYLIKSVRDTKKMSIDLNPKQKKRQISFSSLVFKSNLININDNTINPYIKIKNGNKKLFLSKNCSTNKNEDFDIYEDKSTTNLTSSRINNESSIINNYIKRVNLDSSRNINQKNNNNNLIYKKKNNIKLNNNNKEMIKRCRHKQVKREIYTNNNNTKNNFNNNINQINYNKKRNSNNKTNEPQNETKNKSITIPINKRIKDNFFNNPKKIKTNFNYKENKENIEINENIREDKYKRIKSPENKKKNNSITKYATFGRLFEKRYYKINSKNELNIINKNFIKVKKKEKNEIYFNENELNENKNCETMINKVLYFETSSNGLLNQFNKTNDDINNLDSLNKNHSTKNIKEKKESCSTVISSLNNNEEKENIKNNIANIIKNNLNNKINKKRSIIRKSYNTLLFQKFKTDATLDTSNIQNKIKNLNKPINKEGNLTINQDYYTSENNTNSLTINRDFTNRRKRFKSLNLNMESKKYINHKKNLNLFYKIFECDNFLKIFFSFGVNDINLLNKMSLVSKKIYKKLKPLIYQKISELIEKYNANNNTKNKIKKNLMKNNSSLLKLSPAILRKKYTDLIFENNNEYDIEIKKDLTRTFPDNVLFKYGNSYYNKLYHILTAYSNFNKNIGYVQGLNFLAAHIIYIFEDETNEFIFLDAMIHKFEFDKILDNNLNNKFFVEKTEKINKYIINKIPKLNIFLSEHKLNIEFFITNWILTLFSDSMETEYLLIIWDYMIIFGWKFFKFFILNVLILFENDILNSTQSNLTYIKKNILKNEKFKNDFHKLIKDTIQMISNEEIII